MAIELISFELPERWACPLLYGDESGLDNDDQCALDGFIDWRGARVSR